MRHFGLNFFRRNVKLSGSNKPGTHFPKWEGIPISEEKIWAVFPGFYILLDTFKLRDNIFIICMVLTWVENYLGNGAKRSFIMLSFCLADCWKISIWMSGGWAFQDVAVTEGLPKSHSHLVARSTGLSFQVAMLLQFSEMAGTGLEPRLSLVLPQHDSQPSIQVLFHKVVRGCLPTRCRSEEKQKDGAWIVSMPHIAAFCRLTGSGIFLDFSRASWVSLNIRKHHFWIAHTPIFSPACIHVANTTIYIHFSSILCGNEERSVLLVTLMLIDWG